MSYPIYCDGPGPHSPADGILGTSERDLNDHQMLCEPCTKVETPEEQAARQYEMNEKAIRDRAGAALATNRTYLNLSSPTAAQTTAQVKALSRQNVGLIRLLLGLLDGTD